MVKKKKKKKKNKIIKLNLEICFYIYIRLICTVHNVVNIYL